MRGAWRWLLLAVGVLLPQPALAQAELEGQDNVSPSLLEVAPLTERARRAYLQSAFNKVRPGSYLKEDKPVAPSAPSTSGALGKRRDDELSRHYARVAQLDVLMELSTKARNFSLSERIETLRRREVRRFLLAMQSLQARALEERAEYGP